MRLTKILFTTKIPEDTTTIRRDISQYSLFTLDTGKNDDGEIQNLKDRIRDLESTVATVKKDIQLREAMLQNLVDVGKQNCEKLRAELESSKRDQLVTASRLMHAQLDQALIQMNAKISNQRVQDSAHTLCKGILADRLSLEVEMKKRTATADAMKQKNNYELARIKRTLSEKHLRFRS